MGCGFPKKVQLVRLRRQPDCGIQEVGVANVFKAYNSFNDGVCKHTYAQRKSKAASDSRRRKHSSSNGCPCVSWDSESTVNKQAKESKRNKAKNKKLNALHTDYKDKQKLRQKEEEKAQNTTPRQNYHSEIFKTFRHSFNKLEC